MKTLSKHSISNNPNSIDVYLLEAHNASYSGYDTFRKEFLNGMKQWNFLNLHVIVEDSLEQQFVKKEEENVTYIYFPRIREKRFSVLEHYMKECIKLTNNMIFISNSFPAIFNVKTIRKLFPKAKIMHIVHDLPWLTIFNGNETAYMNYIQSDENEILSPQEDKFVRYCTYDIVTSFREIDRIISLCQSTYQLLTDFYDIPSEKVRLIANGMKDYSMQYQEKGNYAIRKKYGLPESELLILLVGRLTYSKGANKIEKLLDQIAPSVNYKLIYAGSSDIYQWISPKMAESVIPLGFKKRSEMLELYSITQLGLFPSYHEQCSYVGIEFLMHGIPVIATSAYGVRDMFYLDNAFIVSNTITPITVEAIKNKRNQARKTYLRNYTDINMCKQYASLIIELTSFPMGGM